MRKNMNNKERGPLIKVQIGPHRYAKMYEADAIKQGLTPKRGKLPSDKGSTPPPTLTPDPLSARISSGQGRGENDPALSEPPQRVVLPRDEWEDFTEVPGIGKASCEALHANGIYTYEDLLIADVSFLTAKAQKAVEALREGLG